jgi:hypothetical protein
VVGAAAESGSIPVSEFKVDRPTVLVMGEWFLALPATLPLRKSVDTCNLQHV